jgi:hypothetical protein
VHPSWQVTSIIWARNNNPEAGSLVSISPPRLTVEFGRNPVRDGCGRVSDLARALVRIRIRRSTACAVRPCPPDSAPLGLRNSRGVSSIVVAMSSKAHYAAQHTSAPGKLNRLDRGHGGKSRRIRPSPNSVRRVGLPTPARVRSGAQRAGANRAAWQRQNPRRWAIPTCGPRKKKRPLVQFLPSPLSGPRGKSDLSPFPFFPLWLAGTCRYLMPYFR